MFHWVLIQQQTFDLPQSFLSCIIFFSMDALKVTKAPTDKYLLILALIFCCYKSCFSEHGSLHTRPTTSIGQILRSELTVLMVCTFKIWQILSNHFLNKQCMSAPISQPDGTMYLCLRTSPALYHKQLGTFSVKENPTNSLTGSNHYLCLTLNHSALQKQCYCLGVNHFCIFTLKLRHVL